MSHRHLNQRNPPAAAFGEESSSRPPAMEVDEGKDGRGQKKGSQATQKPGPWPPKIEPFVPKNTDYNPRELKSWARRTGFNPNISGETSLSGASERGPDDRSTTGSVSAELDVEKGPAPPSRLGGHGSIASAFVAPKPKEDMEPILGRRRNGAGRGVEIDPAPAASAGNGGWRSEEDDVETEVTAGGFRRADRENRRTGADPIKGLRDEGRGIGAEPVMGTMDDEQQRIGNGDPSFPNTEEGKKESGKPDMDVQIDMFTESDDLEDRLPRRPPSGLKCGLTENPGFPSLILYGLQQYLSLAGSLVFIPLIMVPAMGGTDEHTATVISTMLLVSGITTILNSYFGTRLPLIQGSSFIYLAPALVIANSEEFRNLSDNKFKHIMRELQGAIIVGSIFQIILGYSGLMSLLLRLINPVVVAPTVAIVGLAYFSYGFPQAGNCVEISIPQIVLVLIFTLYLRKVSILGHHIFMIYAVPLSVALVWAYAFFLTTGGAYNYKDCSTNIPTSNILLDSCRRHTLTMKSCRTDASNAWRTAAWVRVPYPFQWGKPTFHFRTSFIMVLMSFVASVDSVGSYHATSLLINLRPPTHGIVSRGIGLEGCSSILAGLWGTGTSSTTLTENIHTINVTKMANRRALELGALFLILFSFVGKVGAVLASIPLSLAAALLCFTWALIVALGLSTLQYTQSASSRNIIIVGFTLFISLSIPSYFQQYQPISNLILPSYLVPYAAASNGPIHLGSKSHQNTMTLGKLKNIVPCQYYGIRLFKFCLSSYSFASSFRMQPKTCSFAHATNTPTPHTKKKKKQVRCTPHDHYLSCEYFSFFSEELKFTPFKVPGYLTVFHCMVQLNYALNGLLSLNVVVALVIAFVLDNTVPGSKQERGVYIWSERGRGDGDRSLADYALPRRVGRFFGWVKWVG